MTRPVLSQFLSLKVRRSANFLWFMSVVGRIVRLKSCERVGRAPKYSTCWTMVPDFELLITRRKGYFLRASDKIAEVSYE